jgi:PAS domain S-box-containing protein
LVLGARGWFPVMVREGQFTAAAITINMLAGVFFLVAVLWFALAYLRLRAGQDLLFACLALIFGLSSLIFGTSSLWSGSWWLWHLLRLAAYILVCVFLFREYTQMNRELRTYRNHLEGLVEERTEELAESEEQTNAILRSSGEAIRVIDQAFNVLRVNNSMEVLTGVDAERAVGMKCYNLFRSDACQTGQCTLARLLRGETTIKAEMLKQTPNGRMVEVEIMATSIRRRDGSLLAIESYRDITVRKRAEEELRFHDTILLNLAEGVYLIRTRDGVIVFANPQLERMFGYLPGELVGKHVSTVNASGGKSAEVVANEIMNELVRTGTWGGEVENIRKDGVRFWSHANVSTFEHSHFGQVWISVHEDITERKLAAEALERSERNLQAVVEGALDGIVAVDAETRRFIVVNKAMRRMLGYSREEMQGLSLPDIHPSEDMPRIAELLEKQLKGEISLAPDVPLKRQDGSIFYADINSTPTELGGRSCLISVFRDITERKQAEEEREKLQAQFIQAQKMESVGRLAGGVAHEFNNMLHLILGHCELALDQTIEGSPLREDLKEIEKAAQRSADLTRQLLAFARRQTAAPKVLDPNDTVSGMLKVLGRLIGEDITLVWKPGNDLWPVKMDPSQINQILANLAVNSRDAIDGVGQVTIETRNITLDEAYCVDHVGFVPGEFVLLAFSDSGRGMGKEILEHLFEPFFTTKGVGEGTGLGLASVYGAVKQNDGFINVDSELGQGTTVKVYLPRFVGEAAVTLLAGKTENAPGHGETVLMVEDEVGILNMGKMMLERLGYKVLTASTTSEALRQVEAHGPEIRLLITDVVMPEMNGRELAERIKILKPGLKCLFMSGYTSNVIAHRGVLDRGVHFLQKPFSLKDLAVKARQALEG